MDIILLKSKCEVFFIAINGINLMIFTDDWKHKVLDLMSRMGLL